MNYLLHSTYARNLSRILPWFINNSKSCVRKLKNFPKFFFSCVTIWNINTFLKNLVQFKMEYKIKLLVKLNIW